LSSTVTGCVIRGSGGCNTSSFYLACLKFKYYFATDASTMTQTPEMRIQRVRLKSAGLVGGARAGEGLVAIALVGPVKSPQAALAKALASRTT
jgi:hypothetical protein